MWFIAVGCVVTLTLSLLVVPLTVRGGSAGKRAEAMITKIIIDSIQSPTFDGVSFGEVGRYEKLVGRAFGELDPESPLNAVITDIALAPRNARGKVEYATDFYILKPVDAARGNKVLLCDVTNRGNKITYLPLNFPFRAPPQFPPINDPSTAEDAGTGYLMRQGYTLVWTGWDATAPAGNGRMTTTVPIASAGGTADRWSCVRRDHARERAKRHTRQRGFYLAADLPGGDPRYIQGNADGAQVPH